MTHPSNHVISQTVLYCLFPYVIGAVNWERFGDSVYTFVLDVARGVDTTWADASYDCKSLNAWLVSIESVAEQEYIQQRIREKVEGQGQTFAREQWWTSGHWDKDREKWVWQDGKEGKERGKINRNFQDY